MEERDSLISECSLECVGKMLAGHKISRGMIPKLKAIEDAIEAGVKSAHIIDGRVPHAVLLEIFTRAGIGTKIE